MKTKKIMIGLLLTTLIGGTLLSGCAGGKEATGSSEGKTTITVGFPGADNTWKEDDYYRYISDKTNVDLDFKSLSKDSADEKVRIWIASGNMPDVVFSSSFYPDEYKKYGEQGTVKAFPDGWEEKYPNVAYAVEMSGVKDKMEEIGNGKFYGLIRTLDHYSAYLDDFRAAFNEGKDLRAMMNESQYLFLDSYGFAYRKDWAEKLGIQTDYLMEYDDFIDMVLKFNEADLGGVGTDNMVGIAIDFTEAPNFFVTAFNSSYKYFYKNESGQYVCGLLDDSTTEGIKKYAEAYRSGVLSRDFYTLKDSDLDALFCSQRAGVIFPRASTYVGNLIADFEKANPGLDGEECIGVCWIKSPDGKVHGRLTANHQGIYYFSPDLSDEKFDKILSLSNYISSEDGGQQVRLGVPDVDYRAEGDGYTILREKNEKGLYDNLSRKYPSYSLFASFSNPVYPIHVDASPYAKEIADGLMEAKRSSDLSLLEWDDDRDAYTAEDYAQFRATYDVNYMFSELVVSEGDIEELWLQKRAEFEGAARSVAANMNKALSE